MVSTQEGRELRIVTVYTTESSEGPEIGNGEQSSSDPVCSTCLHAVCQILWVVSPVPSRSCSWTCPWILPEEALVNWFREKLFFFSVIMTILLFHSCSRFYSGTEFSTAKLDTIWDTYMGGKSMKET